MRSGRARDRFQLVYSAGGRAGTLVLKGLMLSNTVFYRLLQRTDFCKERTGSCTHLSVVSRVECIVLSLEL